MAWSTQTINGLNCVLVTGVETLGNLKTAIDNNSITTVTYNSDEDYTIYNFGTTRLIIWGGGELTIDPDIEMIFTGVVSSANDRVAVEIHGAGSRLNIGKEIETNGRTAYSRGTAIVHTGNYAYYGRMRSIVAHGGGEIHWYGGELKLGDGIGVDKTAAAYRNPDDGAGFGSDDPEWNLPGFLKTYSTNCIITSTDDDDTMQIRINADDDTAVEYNGLVLRGATLPNGFVSATRFFSVNGLRVAQNIIYERAFIQPRTGSTSTGLVLYNQSFQDNVYDADLYFDSDQRWYNTTAQTQPVELHNIDVGSAIRMDSESYTGDAFHSFRRGWGEVWQEINFNISNIQTKAAVNDVAVRIDATNHGDRREPVFGSVAQSSIPTLTYNNRTILSDWADRYQTTTNAQGRTDNIDVLTYLKFVDTTSNVEIFYSKSTTPGEDYFDVIFSKYGYIKKQEVVQLHKNEPINYQTALTADSAITQTNAQVVASYTGISIDLNANTLSISENTSVDKLYDYLKYTDDATVRANGRVDLGFTTTDTLIDLGNFQFTLGSNLTVGSKNQGIFGTANVNINNKSITGITLGSLDNSYYNNIPTTISKVKFNATNGPVKLVLNQATTYLFDAETEIINGGNIEILATTPNVRISTSIPEQSFVQLGANAFAIDPILANLNFTGVKENSRVVIRDSNGDYIESIIADATGVIQSSLYELNSNGSYEIFLAGYVPIYGEYSVTPGNNYRIVQKLADGYENNSLLVRSINGNVQNANGVISANTLANTITFYSNVDLRESLSAMEKIWSTIPEVYTSNNSIIPWDLNSVKGISIDNNYSVIDDSFSLGEGYARIDRTTDVIDSIRFRITTVANESAPNVKIIEDSVITYQNTYSQGEIDELLTVSGTTTNANAKILVKNPIKNFVYKDINLVASGRSVLPLYKNDDTNFAEPTALYVSELLPEDESQYRLLQTSITPPTDTNGVSHTFDRILEISTDVRTIQEVRNQLSAIAAYNDYYITRPYTDVDEDYIELETGSWIRYRDGTEITGSLGARITRSSVLGGDYATPETRALTLTLNTELGKDVKYAVYYKDTGEILVDVDNTSLVGNLTTNSSVATFVIRESTDANVSLAFINNDVSYDLTQGVLLSSGLRFTLNPTINNVELPTTLDVVDDPISGKLKYLDIIDDAQFDWENRIITIPNQFDVNNNIVKIYNPAYFFFAWLKRVVADASLLRHGRAVFAEHQLKPASALDNSHQLKPGVLFADQWVLDVDPTRSTADIVRLEASELRRVDDAFNSGLVYNSPLANGANSMAEVIITGASAAAITNTFNQSIANGEQIQLIKNFAGWLASNGKMIGIKPMPTIYDPEENFSGNL